MITIRQFADIRRALDHVVSGVPEDDLFRVPAGFVNHVAWNAAHLVVTQQILTYGLSGLEPRLPGELIDRYRKGTGPDTADPVSFRAAMEYVHKAPEWLAEDYEAGRFSSFTPYKTSSGIRLDSFEDAMAFNNFHEGIHLGYILALKKALS